MLSMAVPTIDENEWILGRVPGEREVESVEQPSELVSSTHISDLCERKRPAQILLVGEDQKRGSGQPLRQRR